jgi:hypothetical protein
MGVTSRPKVDAHDCFADLLPVARARTFTSGRSSTPLPAPTPKPKTTKPMTLITNGKASGNADVNQGLKPLQIGSTTGFLYNMPAVFKAMEPTGTVTDMDSYTMMREGYETGRAHPLQESTNLVRLAQGQPSTVEESLPPCSNSSMDLRSSTVDENIVAPQPHWQVDDFMEEHERKIDSPRSLEEIRAELEAINVDEDEVEPSPPSVAQENPLDPYLNGLPKGRPNGLSNGRESRCSHDDLGHFLHSHSHDRFKGHCDGTTVNDSKNTRHVQDADGSNAESQDCLSSTSNGNGLPNGYSNGYQALRTQSHSQDSVTILSASHTEGVAPMVRLTQEVYDSLCAEIKAASRQKIHFLNDKALSQREIANLQQRIQDIGCGPTNSTATSRGVPLDEQGVHNLRNRIHNLQQELTRLTGTGQRKTVQLEQYKQQKSTLGAILSQKDHDIRKLESDMAALEATIRTKAQEHDQHRDGRVKGLVDEITKRDKEIGDLKNDISQMEISVAILRNAVSSTEGERDNLRQTQKHAHEYTTRNKNLSDTLSEREELYKRQTQKVESLNAANQKLISELHLQRKNAPSQNLVNDLQTKLKDKTTENSRNINELRDMRKRYESCHAAIEKAANNQKSLCGAAHLIKPSQNVKFNSTVFGCVECYVKHLDCDSGARCRNCIDSDSMCSRWRCSLVHILKYCPPDRPCGLVHGQDGWVSTKEARPQW